MDNPQLINQDRINVSSFLFLCLFNKPRQQAGEWNGQRQLAKPRSRLPLLAPLEGEKEENHRRHVPERHNTVQQRIFSPISGAETSRKFRVIWMNVNIGWHDQGMGDGEYMAAFDDIVMPIAREFNPGLVIILAGFDAATGDPLGACFVSPGCYACMTRMLMPLAGGGGSLPRGRLQPRGHHQVSPGRRVDAHGRAAPADGNARDRCFPGCRLTKRRIGSASSSDEDEEAAPLGISSRRPSTLPQFGSGRNGPRSAAAKRFVQRTTPTCRTASACCRLSTGSK